MVGGDEVEEVLGRDVVLSSQRGDEVPADVDDRLVHVDVVLDDLLAVVRRYERVVGRDELAGDRQQRLVGPREQPVDRRVVHHAREVATPTTVRRHACRMRSTTVHANNNNNKTRRDVSAKILHRTNSVGTTCTTTTEQTEGMLLEDYCQPTYNKLLHSAMTRSTVVGVIHKLTVGEFVDHTNTLMPCCGKNFLSPKYRNYSRDSDHANLGDSQSSKWPTRIRNLKSLALAVPEKF